jgi:D-threonate/D-erythronate kinase
VSRLRLLADDLTGALDSAAEFVPLVGPVPTFWYGGLPDALPASAALDAGTREMVAAASAERVARLAPAMKGADIAFKKIDSLLRGAIAAEIAACLRVGDFEASIVAPAFPAQGRITRDGRQLVRRDDGWTDAGVDLAADLRALGLDAVLRRPGDAMPAGLSIWEAENDADLACIVAAGRRSGGRVLWCGTAGLAAALVGRASAPAPVLHRPVLGLFGSDHEVMLRQLGACGEHWLRLPGSGADSADQVIGRLRNRGVALVSIAIPAGMSRKSAARRIGTQIARLVQLVPRPATLVVSGGETLGALCRALGATSLEVVGRMLPGIPVSLLHGGGWDGVTVISKSGAFGDADLLRRLAGLDAEAEG